MTQPLIGISTYLEKNVRWGEWELDAALLATGYPCLVQEAGGLAAMLPPDVPENAEAVVAPLDGLIAVGGPDVEPALYGAEAHPRTDPPPRARDAWELALVDAALGSGTPFLGICRGMHVLNVALGGTLVQHQEGHSLGEGAFGSHSVKPVPGTLYASIAPEEIAAPTCHHQAVDRLGRDLVPSAYADDGTVEAIELPGSVWVLGVQWHPEMDTDLRVMQALLQATS